MIFFHHHQCHYCCFPYSRWWFWISTYIHHRHFHFTSSMSLLFLSLIPWSPFLPFYFSSPFTLTFSSLILTSFHFLFFDIASLSPSLSTIFILPPPLFPWFPFLPLYPLLLPHYLPFAHLPVTEKLERSNTAKWSSPFKQGCCHVYIEGVKPVDDKGKKRLLIREKW